MSLLLLLLLLIIHFFIYSFAQLYEHKVRHNNDESRFSQREVVMELYKIQHMRNSELTDYGVITNRIGRYYGDKVGCDRVSFAVPRSVTLSGVVSTMSNYIEQINIEQLSKVTQNLRKVFFLFFSYFKTNHRKGLIEY